MSRITVSSFYKYVEIASPLKFQREHQKYCNELGIKGKILVGKEGINGSISGAKEQIEKYKKDLIRNALFRDMKFKDTSTEKHPFKKTIVRVRNEVVTFKNNVDFSSRGEHLSPTILKSWIENNEDILLLDARNDYESSIGKFKGAITPKIETFSEFPKIVKQLKNYKNKKIVTYCTGGIRCEKASAFLKQQGFKQVYQLEGGILDYIQQYPDSYFEGRCFVFDDRLSIPSGPKNSLISYCEICHKPAGNYINCSNVKCDKLFISCDACEKEMEHNCSKKCLISSCQNSPTSKRKA